MSDSVNTRLTGKVKWFNNKSGFGFITVCEGSALAEKDIFVHFSSVNVGDTQYRYLVQGEYVDFDISKPAKGDHEYHAVNVSGVKGGPLMCETRRLNVEKRTYEPRVYKTQDAEPKDDGYTRVEKKRSNQTKQKPAA
jgi:CspA family cold shock protein